MINESGAEFVAKSELNLVCLTCDAGVVIGTVFRRGALEGVRLERGIG